MSVRGFKRAVFGVLALGCVAAVTACGGDGGGFTLGANLGIQVSPPTVAFGAVPIDTEATETLVITHIGDEGTLEITSVSLSADSSTDFTLTEPSATRLAPGEMATFEIIYRPSDNVADQGRVVIRHNVRGTDDVVVEVSALAQIAKLYFTPTPVDFGDVQHGRIVDTVVTVTNGGADRATLNALTFSDETSSDFRITEEPAYPIVMPPGGEVQFKVRYAPTGGNIDSGEVRALYTNEEGLEKADSVRVRGAEILPRILVTPGAIDFGWQPLNQESPFPVTIINGGTDTLVIDSIAWEGAGHPALRMAQLPANGTTLAPDDSLGFMVFFQATEAFPMSTDALATITIASNDPEIVGAVRIPVFGRIQAPSVVVVPAEGIDFGFVAQNLPSLRQVIVRNGGYAPLQIDTMSIVQGTGTVGDEFKMRALAAFPPSSGTGSAILNPNEVAQVDLTFTNLGPDAGHVEGELHITSNDTLNPHIIVPLTADRAGAPVCTAVLEPAQLDYGVVVRGGKKEMAIKIRNTGTGNCSFMRAEVSSCTGSFFPGFGASCSPGTASREFKIMRSPPPVAQGIPPGGTADIIVQFAPTGSASLFQFDDYYGLVQVTMHNPYGPPGQDNSFKVPSGSSGIAPNLKGKSGISRVSVLPDRIDVGEITLGCYSPVHRVSVYNSGTAPLTVSNIRLEGCRQFRKNHPGLPIDVSQSSPLHIDIAFLAQEVGEETCALVIDCSDTSTPRLSVPLRGAGTTESHVVDVFQQIAGQEVDILFVVDDSGSMCEEQDRLKDNLDDFIQHAQTWGNSYQIGVVSTCINPDDGCEEDVVGVLQTKHAPRRWVTNSNWPEFTRNVELGCGGAGAQEAGLEAAHLALSLPRIHLSDTPCTAHRDCVEPDWCMEDVGLCGGPNGGFLRRDAALEIVFLSDEEDQSPATPDFYVDFFKSIKGFANEGFFHAHSIVGDKRRGCDTTTTTGEGTTAAAGDRYIYVSEATGGIVESICNDSFADALSDIGIMAFDLKVQFFLSRAADPPTLVVSVNGSVCRSGWTYDPPSNSIIFDRDGSCMPEEGDEIRIEYDAICYLSVPWE